MTPSTSNGSSAANILTSFSRKRSVARAGSAFAFRTNQAEPVPSTPPAAQDLAVDLSHRNAQDRRIDDPQGDDVSKGAKGPAGVVVRSRVGGRIILGVEHHVDHPAIRLIHPNDIAADGHLLSLVFVGSGFASDFASAGGLPPGWAPGRPGAGAGFVNLDLGLTIETVDLGPLPLQ